MYLVALKDIYGYMEEHTYIHIYIELNRNICVHTYK